MAINLSGYLFSDNGTEVQGATVTLIDSGGNSEATDTTNSSGTTDQSDSTLGLWEFAEADEDVYDVKIQSGSQVRYIKGNDRVQFSEIDVRNNAGATTPTFTFTNYATSVTSHQVGRFRSLNSSAADNDEIYLSFNLQNSASEDTEYARITAKATDVTNGEEDGQLEFQVLKSGSPVQAFTITSSTAGAQSIDFNQDSFTFGQSGDTDITFTFDANSNDGVITWMEDEDYFAFSDEILMNTTEKIHLRDTAIYINSSADGQLDLVADTEIQIAATTIDINGAVALDGAITGATNITLSGELDAATLDLSSSADIAGDLGLSGGADGALQFTNAGENSIKIPDNQASALIIEEANNAYITFVTTDSSEAITVAKATTFSAGIANTGTIAAGVWEGTDVAVAHGGTGASSLTDGGVLLGSGTSAVTAMAVLADGEMIVGDGTTDPVAESGATLRTSIGVGTGDSPQFTGIELGHASDTTIARSGSGAITVEGTQVLLAGAALTGSTIVASGIIKTDDTTNATSTTDGSLQTDGGLSVALDAIFGDDVTLITDSAVLNLGVGSDVSITHDGTTGGTITGTPMVYESKGSASLANDTHSGVVLEMLAGESLAVGDWVYVDSTDARVSKADANDTGDNGHYPAIGVAVSAQGSAGSAVKILTHGTYNDSDGFGGDLTEGNLLYLSETAGGITATAPSDDGDMVQVVGVAIGPRDVLVNPSLVVVEIA